MSVNLQEAIQEQVRILSEEEMRQVLNFMRRLRQPEKQPQSLGELIDDDFNGMPPEMLAKPVSAIFEDLSNQVSLEEWRELPADGAENHDHYLYGAPKKIR